MPATIATTRTAVAASDLKDGNADIINAAK